jgi:anti-sigma regulatory factor (Ser/Thr protein kinase)
LGGRAAAGRGLKHRRWVGAALELALENTLDALEACRPDLERFFRLNTLDPIVANRVDVIFEELASNTLRHGFTPGSKQSLRVRLQASQDLVEMTFEDDGQPFNPIARTDPPTPNSLETATLGGLGVPLVRKLAASIRYESLSALGDGSSGGGFRPANRIIVTLARTPRPK